MARSIAEQLGFPPGHGRLTPAEELKLWLTEKRDVDTETMIAQGSSVSDAMRARFPYRERLLKADGRSEHARLMVEYCEVMARKAADHRDREDVVTPIEHQVSPSASPTFIPPPMESPDGGPPMQPGPAPSRPAFQDPLMSGGPAQPQGMV